MNVVVSEEAKAYVNARGGAAFVRAHRHRCCTGSITLLDITTTPPADLGDFVVVDADELEGRFCGVSSGKPDQLLIELRGMFKRHPMAFWDGFAIKP
jgi:hypothetical protein